MSECVPGPRQSLYVCVLCVPFWCALCVSCLCQSLYGIDTDVYLRETPERCVSVCECVREMGL